MSVTLWGGVNGGKAGNAQDSGCDGLCKEKYGSPPYAPSTWYWCDIGGVQPVSCGVDSVWEECGMIPTQLLHVPMCLFRYGSVVGILRLCGVMCACGG
ncbi:hypothetical protein TcYC6_0057860 [Trypanosoma cruzi]|nr:hypothetical protein TcYC6_0057860 [Trypanosoma cruzi]